MYKLWSLFSIVLTIAVGLEASDGIIKTAEAGVKLAEQAKPAFKEGVEIAKEVEPLVKKGAQSIAQVVGEMLHSRKKSDAIKTLAEEVDKIKATDDAQGGAVEELKERFLQQAEKQDKAIEKNNAAVEALRKTIPTSKSPRGFLRNDANDPFVKQSEIADVVKEDSNNPVVRQKQFDVVMAGVVEENPSNPVVRQTQMVGFVKQDPNDLVVKQSEMVGLVKEDQNNPVVRSDQIADVVRQDPNDPVVKQSQIVGFVKQDQINGMITKDGLRRDFTYFAVESVKGAAAHQGSYFITEPTVQYVSDAIGLADFINQLPYADKNPLELSDVTVPTTQFILGLIHHGLLQKNGTKPYMQEAAKDAETSVAVMLGNKVLCAAYDCTDVQKRMPEAGKALTYGFAYALVRSLLEFFS